MKTFEDLFRLDAKVALVTGGAGILGKCFCEGLAAFGAKVALVDLDMATAMEAASCIDGDVRAFQCDVADSESVDRMVSDVVQTFGRIDVLHNNAATKSGDLKGFFAPFEDYTLEQWRDIMSVNLDGMFLVAQRVGRQMIKQDSGGSIIQTGSIYGAMGPDQRIYEGSNYLGMEINTPAVYSASKAGVVGLTRHLATYWASAGIRVNTLSPGGVESGQNDLFSCQYSDRVPLGRMATGIDMIGALVYLASDASSYVTGQNLLIDGGLSSW